MFQIAKGFMLKHYHHLLAGSGGVANRGSGKPCWVSWDILTQPKHPGGLGFLDLEIFRWALLAKQAQRVIHDPTSLSGRILKAVHFPNRLLLEAELGGHPSQFW